MIQTRQIISLSTDMNNGIKSYNFRILLLLFIHVNIWRLCSDCLIINAKFYVP